MPQADDRDVCIIGGLRTPFGRFQGALSKADPIELVAGLIDAIIRRTGIDPAQVQGLYSGVGLLGGGMLSSTRQILLSSSLPDETSSLGVDRACCSGMTAIGLAAKDIQLGEADCVLAGGFEFLSQVPYNLPRTTSVKPAAISLEDPLLLRARKMDSSIAQYTSAEAERAGVNREHQDQWALRSHRNYFAALEDGRFDDELWVGAESLCQALNHDEAPRRDTDLAKLAALRSVYGTNSITPGNTPGLSDGACFVLIASRSFADRSGLTSWARIADYSQLASGPTSGSHTPALAINALLTRNRMTLDDVDRFEINEAFSATSLVSTLRLANGDQSLAENLRHRTNINGGAVSIGHPLGASGARLALHLSLALRNGEIGRAIAAICGGFGQGDGLMLERA